MKTEKILNKVAGRQYVFTGSREDLDRLRSLADGQGAGTKPGDPSFQAYAAAVNVVTEFSTQALDVLELIPFNNKLADLQEEYAPAYPPLSPVTTSFFAAWMVLDALDPGTGLTLGALFAHYLKTRNDLDSLQQALVPLNSSYCAFYEVVGVGRNEVALWDIVERCERRCWNSSGYAGRPGEVWFVRVLPPYRSCGNLWVTLNTPYVFREGGRQAWEAFFARCQGSVEGSYRGPRDYLKFGKFPGYWLEFVFQAYAGYTGNAIYVSGVPDRPDSRPHSEHGLQL